MVLFCFVQILVQELTEEGKNAIEYPASPLIPDLGPEFYRLGELQDLQLSTYVFYFEHIQEYQFW